jgi:hypothetical protein
VLLKLAHDGCKTPLSVKGQPTELRPVPQEKSGEHGTTKVMELQAPRHFALCFEDSLLGKDMCRHEAYFALITFFFVGFLGKLIRFIRTHERLVKEVMISPLRIFDLQEFRKQVR